MRALSETRTTIGAASGPVHGPSAMSAGALLLAHQGGWDEALLIGGPILVIVGLLMLAKRRVDAAHAAQSTGQDGDEHTGPDGDQHDGRGADQHTGQDTGRRPADG